VTCEFLSGLTQLPFPSTAIAIGTGGITTAGTLYFYLTARNRAGWTIASSPIAITYPANSSITITLPPAARGLGTDFIRYSISANTTNNPITSYQLAEWENYQPDQYTRRTLTPIVLSRNEHIAPTSSVAIPADLPTLGDLINGQHRLVVGGLPSGVTSSYYKYSQYITAPTDGTKIIEPHPGEKWLRVSNPYTAQTTDASGIGGCAIDVRLLDQTYLIPPPLYDPIQPNPVKGAPIKLTWHNNSTIPLKAGTNLGLEIRQGTENRTDSFNGKLILTLKGYTDGLGGLDRFDAGGVNSLPNVDIDRVWGYADDAIGILTLDKDLPSGVSVVYEIAPYFTSQQFQGNLAANELISTYIYPYTQSGKNVGSLWAITGDLVLPIAERMHVVPQVGVSVKVNSGSAIVKGYTFTQVPDQTIYGLTPNTPNQKIAIDGNGVCAIRNSPLGSEAIRAIVSTASGTSKLGTLSSPIAIAASGKATLTLAYPCDSDGIGTIRSDYPILGGDLGQFNPNFVRIFAYNSTNYYPALSGGNTQIAIVPNTTQSLIIDSLGASIPIPTNPTDTLFGLFSPPTIAGTPTTGGTIPAGSYQFFAIYYYDGSTVSKIDQTDPSVIRESELTISDLYLLNQGWGRPVYNLVDLRAIDRSDTFAWQQRPVTGGSIFYYDPDSIATDDSSSIFKPAYLTAAQSGRWIIRKSYSVTPAGTWANTTSYNYLEIVEDDDGSSYLYRNPAPSVGNPLTNTTYWQKLAGKGNQGIQGIPGTTGTATVGTNPNIPALNATAIYTVASTSNLAIGQYYAFSGTAGTLLVTAIPSTTTVTLQNIDSVAATAIAAGTKLLATGKTGDVGAIGSVGIVGATTSGTNPVTPALNGTATYTVDAIAGLAIGQYYKFSGVAGTLIATALPTATTVTLQNIDATVGSAIATGTKLNLTGAKGATGASGSPHVSRGTYSGAATYNKYDEVDSNGSSYWWNNTTSGNTAPPSSDWQLIASIGTPGVAGSNDRSTHTGTQSASTIADFSEAVDDRVGALLVAGSNITLSYNDPANTLTINSNATGTGLTAWQLKTASYTAVNGDRIRAQLSTANLTILCPANPAVGEEFAIQRLDTTGLSLIIDPNSKPFKGVASKDGLFNNGNIGLSERISYVDSAIGWLPQHDRLTYQTHVTTGDPFFANVVLLMLPIGADNSTTFTDSSSYNRVITTIGNTKIVSNKVIFDGSGDALSVASSPDFAMGSGDFTIEWLGESTQTSAYAALLSRRSGAFVSGSWDLYLTEGTGKCNIFWADYSGNTALLISTISTNDGLPHHIAWVRSGNVHTLYIDGVAVATQTTTVTMPDIPGNPLTIGSEVGYPLETIAARARHCELLKELPDILLTLRHPALTPPAKF
jgi:hypothetical protein